MVHCHNGVNIVSTNCDLQEALQKIRQKNTMRREVTVELSSQGFWKTGIRSDVCQVHIYTNTHSLQNLGLLKWVRDVEIKQDKLNKINICIINA